MTTSTQNPDAYTSIIVKTTQDFQLYNYFTVSSYALQLYDIALMFPDEYEYVWKAPFSIGSLMYVVMRYGSTLIQGFGLCYFFYQDPPLFLCKFMFHFIQWGQILLFIPLPILLSMRTYALWRGNLPVKLILICLVLICMAAAFVSLGISSEKVKFQPLPFSGLTCGFTVAAPPWKAGIILFSASVMFEISIFVLTSVRVYHYFRDGNKRIISVIFRDCLLSYIALFFTALATLLLYLTLPRDRKLLRGLLINPMRSLDVVITSRIVLNVRRLVLEPKAMTPTEVLGSQWDSDLSAENNVMSER